MWANRQLIYNASFAAINGISAVCNHFRALWLTCSGRWFYKLDYNKAIAIEQVTTKA